MTMDGSLLDTDIFSEVLKGKNEAVAKNASAYRETFGRYTISAITVMEMVQRIARKDRVSELLTALAAEEVLPFERSTAVLAGEILGELQRTGQRIGKADPMIAAIALDRRLVLVTGNIKTLRAYSPARLSLSTQ
jgi:tRNA(fMet)-specific endonuclease VapC